jgi:hypothetical protein
LPPSQLKRTLYSSLGVTETTCPTCFDVATDEQMDDLYFRQQQRTP